jgi:hypothetical protein
VGAERPDAGAPGAGGFTLLPGFIDAHLHLMSLGASLREIDARYPRVASVDDLAAVVAVRASETERGVWIRGRGLDYARFSDGRMPTRRDLDAVAPHNPVAIIHVRVADPVPDYPAGPAEETRLAPGTGRHGGRRRHRRTPWWSKLMNPGR